MIRPDKAWPEMPPAGDLAQLGRPAASAPARRRRSGASPRPSSTPRYVCVVDRHGNVFSATPSDGSYKTPVIPETRA